MSTPRFAAAALLYAVFIVYASTVTGKFGVHFVAIDPREALTRLLHITLVDNGSDQRADWMGNLAMLVPFGLLLGGTIAAARRLTVTRAASAFMLALVFILSTKYIQLFFPPRTVTLNYVIAQCLGAAIGLVVYGVLQPAIAELSTGPARLRHLRLSLQIYTVLFVLFALAPLDFALNVEDITSQLNRLPGTWTTMGGAGRPPAVFLVVTVMGVLACLPVGALLTLVDHGGIYIGRSVFEASVIGFCLLFGTYMLATLVMSAAPSLPAVGLRTIGIGMGAWVMHGLTRRNPDEIRRRLARIVLWCVPVYLIVLIVVNGLPPFDETSPEESVTTGARSWIPLYNYYIVTKAQAAKNIAAHIAMYAPVGVIIWSRVKPGARGGAISFFAAAILSAAMEAGRYFGPGLAADINAVPLAGAAAWATWAMMPGLGHILDGMPSGSLNSARPEPEPVTTATPLPITPISDARSDRGRVPGWRERAARRRAREHAASRAIGDVEDY